MAVKNKNKTRSHHNNISSSDRNRGIFILLSLLVLLLVQLSYYCAAAFQPQPGGGGGGNNNNEASRNNPSLTSSSRSQTKNKSRVQGTSMMATASSTRNDNDDGTTSPTTTMNFLPMKRKIPDKVIIGYATTCNDKVKVAIRQGCNVIIWAFMELVKTGIECDDGTTAAETTPHKATLKGSFNLDCIRTFIQEMDSEGYDDTVHLIAFGGWNGPHVQPTSNSSNNGFPNAQEWYDAWKSNAGDIFHGIDWDPEGNDNLQSSTNYFTMASLDMMGDISMLAKQDGYVISMAPAQSYLDIENTSGNFSRYVNLTDPTRQDRDSPDHWHEEFLYFGCNVYTYLIAKYGSYIDLISIQFYESYSRAGLNTIHHKIPQETYLFNYIQQCIVNTDQQYFVKFEQDPETQLKNQHISIPLSKLVWGFANGWSTTMTDNPDKVVYFLPECIQAAYQNLIYWQMEPRGVMFWVIDEEGTNDIYYANELNNILHIRNSRTKDDIKEEKETTKEE